MIEPVRRLELVHFQLTRRCNLHCWFCGQQAETAPLRAAPEASCRWKSGGASSKTWKRCAKKRELPPR